MDSFIYQSSLYSLILRITHHVQFTLVHLIFKLLERVESRTTTLIFPCNLIQRKQFNHFNTFTTTYHFRSIQNNEWKSPFQLLSIERVNMPILMYLGEQMECRTERLTVWSPIYDRLIYRSCSESKEGDKVMSCQALHRFEEKHPHIGISRLVSSL